MVCVWRRKFHHFGAAGAIVATSNLDRCASVQSKRRATIVADGPSSLRKFNRDAAEQAEFDLFRVSLGECGGQVRIPSTNRSTGDGHLGEAR